MGTYNTKTVLHASPSLIPAIADHICQVFAADGYEIKREDLLGGGVDISVTKGGFFKAVVGLKTALKITLQPRNGNIYFEAGVGIFGKQIIPTIVMYFVAWPVLITQIWGNIEQAKLDDRALAAAQEVVRMHQGGNQNSYGSYQNYQAPPVPGATRGKFCTKCGNQLPEGAKFCSNCGNPL